MSIVRIDENTRMSKLVKHNGTIYLSGQTAGSDDTNVSEQTTQCLLQVERLLNECGSNRDKILSVTIFIKSMDDFAEMNDVWDAWVAKGEKPARACVEARMARSNVLVELCVIAAE